MVPDLVPVNDHNATPPEPTPLGKFLLVAMDDRKDGCDNSSKVAAKKICFKPFRIPDLR